MLGAFLVQSAVKQLLRPVRIARRLGPGIGNRTEAALRSLEVRARVEVVAGIAGIDALFDDPLLLFVRLFAYHCSLLRVGPAGLLRIDAAARGRVVEHIPLESVVPVGEIILGRAFRAAD